MPFIIGSVTPVTALAAIAASTALPPRARIWTAACEASGWLVAATPSFEATAERPGTGRAAARVIARAIIANLLAPGALSCAANEPVQSIVDRSCCRPPRRRLQPDTAAVQWPGAVRRKRLLLRLPRRLPGSGA